MNTQHKQALETIISKGGFPAQVAQIVLSTGKCSYKQFEILNEASDIYLDIEELDNIDIDNMKHDAVFEDIQKRSLENQMRGL